MKKALQKPKKTKSETHGLANFAKRVFRDLHFSARMSQILDFFVFRDFSVLFSLVFKSLVGFFGFGGFCRAFLPFGVLERLRGLTSRMKPVNS